MHEVVLDLLTEKRGKLHLAKNFTSEQMIFRQIFASNVRYIEQPSISEQSN